MRGDGLKSSMGCGRSNFGLFHGFPLPLPLKLSLRYPPVSDPLNPELILDDGGFELY